MLCRLSHWPRAHHRQIRRRESREARASPFIRHPSYLTHRTASCRSTTGWRRGGSLATPSRYKRTCPTRDWRDSVPDSSPGQSLVVHWLSDYMYRLADNERHAEGAKGGPGAGGPGVELQEASAVAGYLPPSSPSSHAPSYLPYTALTSTTV